jgi:V-type H+-transporting ATPase subunit e
MGFGVFLIFTLIFGGIGGVTPMFLPESPHRPIIKLMLICGSVCCYAMWLTAYVAQLNPLFGPQVSNVTMSLIRKGWT